MVIPVAYVCFFFKIFLILKITAYHAYYTVYIYRDNTNKYIYI